MTKSPAIGIDFGTTKSCVGIWQDNHVEIIENDMKKRNTPSVVSFYDEKRLVGEEALYKSSINPKNTVFNIKRIIGRNFFDKNIPNYLKYCTYELIEQNEKGYIPGKPYIQIKDKNQYYTAEEIASILLIKMKETAEDYLGQSVKDAVISVPAYFNDEQRKAIINAGYIAGLNILQIINEPTATALSYGYNNDIKKKETIIVVDIGGGTYDISVITINNGKYSVRATIGNTHLGGEDFTNRLVDHIIVEIKNKYNLDISHNPKATLRLKKACDRAKCILSSIKETSIDIDGLLEGDDFRSCISRSLFEELNEDLFEKIIESIDHVLKESHLYKRDIDEIVLVGGSARIPKVKEMISSYFDGKKINKTINYDEAVTCGAAIQASILSGEITKNDKNFSIISDIITFSLATDDTLFIERNSKIPIKKKFEQINLNSSNPFLNLFSRNSNNYEYRIYEFNHFIEKPNLLDELIVYSHRVIICINVDENGIYDIQLKKSKYDIYNYQKNLPPEHIKQIIKNNKIYKENFKKEQERIKSMNDLENYIYHLRTPLKNERYVYEMFKNYINNLNHHLNSNIEWIKNNKKADKEEYEKRKLELEKMTKPIFDSV
eukprot:jgi/Orpsp1_1/1191262/evm.model.d7180000084532.1